MKYFQTKAIKKFIGRAEELKSINLILKQDEASILILYGRRRIGKTALIEHAFGHRQLLKFEGLEEGNQSQQIQHFLETLSIYTQDFKVAHLKTSSWKSAFLFLAKYVEKNPVTIYFEELQWMANYRHDLISDLKYVWDNHFSKNDKLKLILCGSSPAYMVNSVITSKALYNRSQRILNLQPFSLPETIEFLNRDRPIQELMDLYLTVGGIPEYLKYFKASGSLYTQLLDLQFKQTNPLLNEPDRIFQSSLSSDKSYRKIIEYLSIHKLASREEIAKHLKSQSGGNLSSQLNDLELSGLISTVSPFHLQKSNKLLKYEISDPFLQFYYKFIKPRLKDISKGRYNAHPERALNFETYRKWLGFEFERWCRHHHFIIAEKLGFGSVEYRSGTYFKRGVKSAGAQIDLLFERRDKTISICEIKYQQNPINKNVIDSMNNKIEVFKSQYLKAKNRSIEKVLITASEVPKSIQELYYFDRILYIKDIFN